MIVGVFLSSISLLAVICLRLGIISLLLCILTLVFGLFLGLLSFLVAILFLLFRLLLSFFLGLLGLLVILLLRFLVFFLLLLCALLQSISLRSRLAFSAICLRFGFRSSLCRFRGSNLGLWFLILKTGLARLFDSFLGVFIRLLFFVLLSLRISLNWCLGSFDLRLGNLLRGFNLLSVLSIRFRDICQSFTLIS